MRVKRKRSSAVEEVLAAKIAPLDARYVVPLAKRAKARVNMKRPTGLKTHFDAEGTAIDSFASLLKEGQLAAGADATGVSADLESAMEQFQQETATRLREADVTDKERDRARVKEKHQLKRRKARALRQAEAQARTGAVDVGVQLGAALSESESESDAEDSGSDGSTAAWRRGEGQVKQPTTMQDDEAAALRMLQGGL
jgi:hypothetical protein